MKTLLLLLLSYNLLSQDCNNDVKRQGSYDLIEVFNHSTHAYEKLRNASDTLQMQVEIASQEKLITFYDAINNYDRKFTIHSCKIIDTALVYWCYDVEKNLDCFLVFGSSPTHYNLTLVYKWKSVIYRVRRKRV